MNETNMQQPSATNWEKLDQLRDDHIDTSDIPPLDESFFNRATLCKLQGKVAVLVHMDADILAWFQAQGAE